MPLPDDLKIVTKLLLSAEKNGLRGQSRASKHLESFSFEGA